MFKKYFYHGLISGIMAASAAIIYNRVHFFATEADFSGIVNAGTMISLNLIVCLIFSIVHYFFTTILKKNVSIVSHLVISILSFAAIIIPISVSLPLSVRNPELFPGLAVPMIFFPALAWFTFKPLFSFDK
jgi:predicted membrane protein